MRAYVRRYPLSRAAALLLGLFWAGLTVTFEFYFFPRRRRAFLEGAVCKLPAQ